MSDSSTQSLPRRALILAAGLGTRLRPLTWRRPKPLVEVWGTPLVDHAIGRLRSWGVEEFAINTHWCAETLEAHVRKRWPGLNVRFSHEPELLGTGGALLPLRDFFEGEEAFWIFNADVVCSVDGRAFAARHAASGALASLWLTPDAGPRTVECSADGTVATFASPRRGEPGTATFTGVHVLSGRIYRYLPSKPEFPLSIVPVYEAAQAAGERVNGCVVENSFWGDTNAPEALLALHADVRSRAMAGEVGADVHDVRWDRTAAATPAGAFVCAAPDAVVAPGARVADSVLGEGVTLAPDAALDRCIVAAGTTVHGAYDHAVVSHPSEFPDARVAAATAALGWAERDTTATALALRGSDRAFYRLRSSSGAAILSAYGTERDENERYALLAAELRTAGIPVPAVLGKSERDRWLAMEDLGAEDLLALLKESPQERWEALYAPVIDTVARLHRDATAHFRARPEIALQPAFGPELYAFERRLFATYLLARRMHLDEGEIAAVDSELERCGSVLDSATQVMVHRDLQSTNVFLRDAQAYLIDFQGMRYGAAAYDMASLLCDPYVGIPETMRERLLSRYAAAVPWGGETLRVFPYAAVQRLCQALGAYGRLSALPGTARFAAHITPAARILSGVLAGLDGFPRLSRIAGALATE